MSGRNVFSLKAQVIDTKLNLWPFMNTLDAMKNLEFMGPYTHCKYMARVNGRAFFCRHHDVHARDNIVDVQVCGRCDRAEQENNKLRRIERFRDNKRVLAIPAESLRRDPSGWHKAAYVILLARLFDAEVIPLSDEDELPSIVERRRPDLLMTMNLPWYNRFSDRPFWHLPHQLPIITVHDDCRRRMHSKLEAVLDRSAAFITPARTPVLREFPNLANRMLWIPYFIPAEIPHYELNENPVPKCLLTGATSQFYPARQRALVTIPARLLDRLHHPGYWQPDYSHAITGQGYFDLLHNYLIGFTCGSIYRCVVAKYFEIPYTGSLLIAEDQPDLPDLGFEPNKHFIPIDKKTDLAALVEQIAADPDRFRAIREAGQRLAIICHTEAAREIEARQIADGVLRMLGLTC